MVEDWFQKAHRYIASHRAFSEVSEVLGAQGEREIQAIAHIELPSRFSRSSQTDLGVRSREPVRFVFPSNFPLVAPRIFLREDFPRVFPHINPSANTVEPCIYAGSLSELLQQPGWMIDILNQLIDWLYKAAANDLLNLEQGWEPMRSDHLDGLIINDDSALEKDALKATTSPVIKKINISEFQNKYYVGRFFIGDSKYVQHVFRSTPVVVNNYIPNPVSTLSELYLYAQSVGIANLQSNIQSVDSMGRNDSYIVVTLGIKRPAKLIGLQRNIEFVTFLILKQKKKKKLIITNTTKVLYLGQLYDSSPELLQRLSGTKTTFDPKHSIAIVGCGSVGSKIALHLARNGSGPFLLIDDDIYLPHNNARHALYSFRMNSKTNLLDNAIKMVNIQAVNEVQSSAFSADYNKSILILESTASLSVRFFFMKNFERPPLISIALFNHGEIGLMLIEAKNHKALLCDIWSFLYKSSMNNEMIKNMLFSSQIEEVNIGQSCRSSTLIISDAEISSYAASFSQHIQKLIDNGLPQMGKVFIASRDVNNGISVEKLVVPEHLDVLAKPGDPLSVRIEKSVADKIRTISEKNAPNEIGGVLIGTVFQNANRLVITDILNAPVDSQISPSRFILGTAGLEEEILRIESRSNGRITYLGTWHSHLLAEGPSSIDLATLEKLEFIRDREPTICLIYSPTGIRRV
jgi:hypothetical protein